MLLTIKFLIQPPQNIQLSVTESCTVASRCCKLLRQIGQQLHAVLAHLLQRKGTALFTVQQIIQRNMKRFRQCCRVFQRRHGSIVFISNRWSRLICQFSRPTAFATGVRPYAIYRCTCPYQTYQTAPFHYLIVYRLTRRYICYIIRKTTVILRF